jgi:hypothetical protein
MTAADIVVLPAPRQNKHHSSVEPFAHCVKVGFSINHAPVIPCLQPKLSDCCAEKSMPEIQVRQARRTLSSSTLLVALSIA